jgi:Polyketide cyclase / dehydrase and lipid transport
VPVPPAAAFDGMMPIDLSTIFTGLGPLPAVTGTVDQTGSWDHVGVSRKPVLSDGTTVYEQITEYTRPKSFAYEVSGFTNPLGGLVSVARGDWQFEPAADGATEIVWTYAFLPRLRRRALVALVIAPLWRRYMRRALDLAVQQIPRDR